MLRAAPLLLAAGLLLAGCTVDDDPEGSGSDVQESTEEPSVDPLVEPATPTDGIENVSSSATSSGPPAEPTPLIATTPAPVVAPTPVAEPTPAPTPVASEPTPAPVAPTPAPTPAPTLAPTPAPTPTSPTPTSPTPTTPTPPPPSWPFAGSFVAYRFTGHESAPDASAGTAYDARLRLRYDGAAWAGTCDIQRSAFRTVSYDSGNRVYAWNNSTETRPASFAPARGSTDVAVGDTVSVGVAYLCQAATMSGLTVQGRTTHSAPRQPDGSDVWYGYWKPEYPAEAYAYWDTKTGLTIAWRDQGSYSHRDGWIEDSDAPLS